MPSNFPFRLGIISPIALEAPVDVGIIGDPTVLQFDTMKYMIGDLNRIVPRIDWRYGYVNNNNIDDFEIYLVFPAGYKL